MTMPTRASASAEEKMIRIMFFFFVEKVVIIYTQVPSHATAFIQHKSCEKKNIFIKSTRQQKEPATQIKSATEL